MFGPNQKLVTVLASAVIGLMLVARAPADEPEDEPRDSPAAQGEAPRPHEGRQRSHRPPDEGWRRDRRERPHGWNGEHRGGPRKGGARGDRFNEWRHEMARMSPQEVEEAMRILKDFASDKAERVEKFIDEHPDAAGAVITRHIPWIRRLMHLKQTDPELYELRVRDKRLDNESRELSRRHRAAEQSGNQREAEELTQRLEEHVNEHFLVRQRLHQYELKRLEQRIAKLREQLERRADHAQEIKKQRLKELTGRPDKGEW